VLAPFGRDGLAVAGHWLAGIWPMSKQKKGLGLKENVRVVRVVCAGLLRLLAGCHASGATVEEEGGGA